MTKLKAEVNESLTRQVANLARLELSDLEVQTFTAQLGDILKYIDQLQTVDVSGVEPVVHPLELPTALREDLVRPSPVDDEGRPKVLASAPDVLYDGYKVPPIL
jgi:aspartyl-tRNA(Asn)/glutamyl-tRNA(Gln) amidotransferase subunit C